MQKHELAVEAGSESGVRQTVLTIASCIGLGTPLGGGFFGGAGIADGELYALVVASKAEGEKLGLAYKLKDRGTADGTDSDDDGLANSERINDDNHPAAQFCRGLRIGGVDDWQLPSRDDLAMLERNLGPRRKNTPELFREGGAEAFEADWYWSSTESAQDSTIAWFVGFGYGYQDSYDKDDYFGVRAVRRLKI
jgi:Protein of unknown function (DUF1566)